MFFAQASKRILSFTHATVGFAGCMNTVAVKIFPPLRWCTATPLNSPQAPTNMFPLSHTHTFTHTHGHTPTHTLVNKILTEVVPLWRILKCKGGAYSREQNAKEIKQRETTKGREMKGEKEIITNMAHFSYTETHLHSGWVKVTVTLNLLIMKSQNTKGTYGHNSTLSTSCYNEAFRVYSFRMVSMLRKCVSSSGFVPITLPGKKLNKTKQKNRGSIPAV